MYMLKSQTNHKFYIPWKIYCASEIVWLKLGWILGFAINWGMNISAISLRKRIITIISGSIVKQMEGVIMHKPDWY